MKNIQWNHRYTTIAVYVFLVVAACLLFGAILGDLPQIWNFLGTIVGYLFPFIYGFALAYLLSPLVRRIEKPLRSTRLKPRTARGISLAASYLLVLVFLGIFGVVVIPTLAESAAQVIGNVRVYTQKINELVDQLMNYIPDENISIEVEKALDNLMAFLYSFISGTLTQVVAITTRLASSVIEVVMGIIISIYMLADKEKLIAQMKKILSALLPPKAMEQLILVAHDGNEKFSGFLIGKIIDSLIIGILCAIGMLIFRMPFVALVSFIVGLTNVIPYFGPFIGAIPGIILVLIGGSPMQALGFGIFILALQQFDGNILGPAILGQSTGLSAMWVIFAILLFGGLYGFVGMLIGVPLLSVIFRILRTLIDSRLRKKGMSTEAADYASEKHQLL